ncbi:MAG TPA: hypothetical protein VF070_08710 [Streptosporangiaceae bacterium]
MRTQSVPQRFYVAAERAVGDTGGQVSGESIQFGPQSGLLAAARLALSAGQADWVRDLAGKALTLTAAPDKRVAARLSIGWSLLWSRRNAEALDTLLSVASDTAASAPAIAWEATGLAATAVQQNGNPAARGCAGPSRRWKASGHRRRTRPARPTNTASGSGLAPTRSAGGGRPFPSCTGWPRGPLRTWARLGPPRGSWMSPSWR